MIVKTAHIYAGKLFDPITRTIASRQLIEVDESHGRILAVRSFARFPETSQENTNIRIIDCRELTILPGFVDVHVHFFLHPYSETSWNDQLTTESLVERTIRATNHARDTLMAGFTTVRDLGTEGAGDADIAFRKCLSQVLIPGPRYFCANRALVSTGSYGPKSSIHPNQEGIDGVTGAEVVDGVDNCVREVRRQIGAGADWIKIYADYRVLSRLSTSFAPAPAALSLPTFSVPEVEAMITASHSLKSPLTGKPIIRVAAHATNYETIKSLLRLGVDSVEHGTDLFDFPQTKNSSQRSEERSQDKLEEVARLFEESGAVWVPTLAAYYTLSPSQSAKTDNSNSTGYYSSWERGVRSFQAALPYISGAKSPRIRMAVGGDTGVFAHGENSLEMKLMYQVGADWRDILRWATICGWGCITGNNPDNIDDINLALEDGAMPFGAIRPGWAADIIGVAGDFKDIGPGEVDRFGKMIDGQTGVKFVMKEGKVYRKS
ncbi:hypothetical protein ONZ45_g10101 [Pleurotus djamor]|nr:hypothetical protein ONZ45_g10101 [Pleurotus djamor]